jgi:DNA helicase HerA-like ATPase
MNVLVLSHMSGPLRLVILSAVIRRLMDERMTTSEAEKHLAIRDDLAADERAHLEAFVARSVPYTLVALDEAQNVLASERRTSAGEVLTRYVREGRNYGLSFMVATQQPTALDSRILAQVDTLIAHKLTVQSDIDYVRRNLKSNLPQEVGNGRTAGIGSYYAPDAAPGLLEASRSSRCEYEYLYPRQCRPRSGRYGDAQSARPAG